MPRKSATAGETKTDPIKKRKNKNWLMVFLYCLKNSIAFILGCKDNAILLNEKDILSRAGNFLSSFVFTENKISKNIVFMKEKP